MAYKFSSEKADKLESEDRYSTLKPVNRLKKAGMQPDQTVVDIGAGTGFYSRSAAEIVGENGQVIGLDILPEMVEKAKSKNTYDHLSFKISKESAFPVEDLIADWAIMTNLFHELEQPESVINEISRVLKTNGRVYLTDWKVQEEEDGPPVEHRIDRKVVINAFTDGGFRLFTSGNLGTSNYEIIMEKP